MTVANGGQVMRITQEAGHISISEEATTQHTAVITKFNVSIEKRIEKIWHESEQQGWNYNQFVSIVMEVLTVLHHRKNIQRMMAPVDDVLFCERSLR